MVTRFASGLSLEYLVTGRGEPVTVFAHGLAGSIAETRPLGSGVAGRRVFFQFRGHGRSDPPPGSTDYADLAADLRAIADHFGATRALGASLGAGALLRLLEQTPDRFDRIVAYLPAVLDEPRPPSAAVRSRDLLAAVLAGDRPTAEALLAERVPAESTEARRVLAEQLDWLLDGGLAPGLGELPGLAAVTDAPALAAVTARALVVGCRGDDAHPVSVAESLAAVLPLSILHVYAEPAVLWTARADLRERIAGFLNAGSAGVGSGDG